MQSPSTTLNTTSKDVGRIQETVARGLTIKSVPVDILINCEGYRWSRISFGCTCLDLITKGGIKTRGITEITGESSAGKTQILLQLCLMVQLPDYAGGLNKGAVFITTEDAFPSTRLYQLIESFEKRYSNLDLKYSENIYLNHIIEAENLWNCISVRLPELMKSKQVGLIVIDSVAAIFRTEPNIIARANDMRKLATALLNLAHTHNCAIVCVNQVTSVIENSNSDKIAPCLGLAWASLVRTRLLISKKSIMFCHKKNDTEFSSAIRTMEVVFAPDFACKSAEFLIVPDGIMDKT